MLVNSIGVTVPPPGTRLRLVVGESVRGKQLLEVVLGTPLDATDLFYLFLSSTCRGLLR